MNGYPIPAVPLTLDELPSLAHRANWRGDPARLPHYIVPGAGDRMDKIVEQLVAALRQDYSGEITIGWAREALNEPGKSRPLRVKRIVWPGHVAVCDVHFYAQGRKNLCVRFISRPRTQITWLRRVLFALGWLGLFILGYAAILGRTDLHASLALEFAQKKAVQGNVEILFQYFLEEYNFQDFFVADPNLFLLCVLKIPLILAAGITYLLLRIPPDLIRYPCDWLGFPRPEDFNAEVNTHNAAVAYCVDLLLQKYPKVPI
jgi:hypothetical protein